PVRAAVALLSAAAGCGVACKRMAAEPSNETDKRRRVRIDSSLWVAMGPYAATAQRYTSRKYVCYNVLCLKSTAPHEATVAGMRRLMHKKASRRINPSIADRSLALLAMR